MIQYILLLIVIGQTKLLDRHKFYYIPLVYGVLLTIMSMVLGGFSPSLLLKIALESLVVYVWALLLHRFDDSIIAWLLVLLIGVIVTQLI